MAKHDKQTIPNLRFKGFDEGWQEKELQEILNVRKEYVNPSFYDLDVELENLVSNSGILIGDTSVRTQTNSFFQKGDILFGRLRPYLNKWWLAEKDGVKSGEIWALETSSTHSNLFSYLVIQSKRFLDSANVTSGTKMPRADWGNLKKVTFNLPSEIEEQTQLGNFFRQLDHRITESRALWEKSRQLKKAMLAKMFPAAGETAPKIRFKGFTGEWERKTLGEVVEIVMGQSPSSTSYTNNPNDFILVQGNADIKDGKVCPRVWTNQLTKQGKAGDIIMSVRAPVGDVGKTDYDIVIGRGVCAIKGNEFIYQTLCKMKSDGYWDSISSGSTFEAVNSNDVKNAEILIPSPEEQTAIGNFFRQLDDTIALQAAETEKLGYLKKALLVAMLV